MVFQQQFFFYFQVQAWFSLKSKWWKPGSHLARNHGFL